RRGDPDYEAAESLIAQRLQAGDAHRILQVHNKADSADADALAALPAGEIALSARTGDGLQSLRQALLQRAGWQAATEGVFIARKRHVLALQRAARLRQHARAEAALGVSARELLAEELRLAHDALGEITGAFTPDDLLGEIFGKFCIGK
ncbi:MAG: tRNA uridine-5-carboxymethylaminomethyl(34) synthesis GTPase MnmE, partial [Burkholderiales bacterium PBB5]